jgi:hypothetical protein
VTSGIPDYPRPKPKPQRVPKRIEPMVTRCPDIVEELIGPGQQKTAQRYGNRKAI